MFYNAILTVTKRLYSWNVAIGMGGGNISPTLAFLSHLIHGESVLDRGSVNQKGLPITCHYSL